jgi:aspartate/methionine/tyrosine aminotransferase
VAGVLPLMCGAIGAHAVARIDALAARAELLCAGKREIVDAFIARHPQLSWTPPPPRALFGFVRAEGVDVSAGLARAAREHGLFAVDGSYFGEPSGFRLSWASLPPHRLAEALDLLGRALGLGA